MIIKAHVAFSWLLSLTICWSIGLFASAAYAQSAKPNILLVVADDLGWADVGWHSGFAKTPNLDRLVREGVELDQHYVQPVCTPTRTALMSGRYPGRFGRHAMLPSNRRAMPLDTVTLASALKSVGYRTYLSGKWHLGARAQWGPNAFGFDHSYGTLTGAADPWTHKYRKGPFEDTWHRDGKFFQEEGNATEVIAVEALKRIAEQQQPWFVYVPFHAVHTPVDAPERYKQLYDGVRFHKQDDKHDSRLRMAAMISQLDDKVGQFIELLEATKQRERTLVIFTSDNGGIESLKNAYVGNVGDSPLNSENDPLRGQKAQLYEGGTRVCAFANWPGVLKPQRYQVPMHVVDWFPTIAELVGYSPDRDLKWDGISQWQGLLGRETVNRERTIYIALPGGASLRQGDWKLILNGKQPAQLFHLGRDPYEQQNLAEQEPAQVARLQSLLAEERALDLNKVPEDLVTEPE